MELPDEPFDAASLRGLPLELQCEVISTITDITDIVKIMSTSPDLSDVVKSCVRSIGYGGEDIILVPLLSLSGMVRLGSIDNNIIVTVSSVREARAISTISAAADMLIVIVSPDGGLNIGRELISSYIRNALTADKVGKLRVAFRASVSAISSDRGGEFFILYGSSLMVGTVNYAGIIQAANETLSGIQVLTTANSTQDIPDYIDVRDVIIGPHIRLGTQLFMEFVSEVDFGRLNQLGDATDNPRLKDIASAFKTGVFGHRSRFIELYMHSNGLIEYFEDVADGDEDYRTVKAETSPWLDRLATEYTSTFYRGAQQEAMADFREVFSGESVDESRFLDWVDRLSLVILVDPSMALLRQVATMRLVTNPPTAAEIDNDDIITEQSYVSMFEG